MFNSKRGISLIALIITIIILLILAAVTINMVLGENGLYNKAKTSVEKYKESSLIEETKMALAELKMELLTNRTVNASSMADYVVQKGGSAVGNGQIYEDYGVYYYENTDGGIVELINDNGELIINRIANKDEVGNKGIVTYHANGGSGNLPKSIRAKSGSIVIVDNIVKPEREGYNFLGWAQEPDATNPIEQFTMTEDDVILYAVWSAITYKVSYNVDGGNTQIEEQTKIHDQNLKLSSTVPTKDNYFFTGWAIDNDSEQKQVEYLPGDDYTLNQNLNLIAVWQSLATINYSNYTSYIEGLTASSTYSNRGVGRIFDGSTEATTGEWHSNSSTGTINFTFKNNVRIHSFTITNRKYHDTNILKNFNLQGSNDNSSWDTIGTFTHNSAGYEYSQNYTCSYIYPITGYKYYRINITSAYSTYATIGEMVIKIGS